jgi:predicted TIM-barrel fold metal-dependent hydrolase
MSAYSKHAIEEFPEGRIMWAENGWPIDARKPADLSECIVLGCSNKATPPSAFCVERHGPSNKTQ